jgi:hypothetical protein
MRKEGTSACLLSSWIVRRCLPIMHQNGWSCPLGTLYGRVGRRATGGALAHLAADMFAAIAAATIPCVQLSKTTITRHDRKRPRPTWRISNVCSATERDRQGSVERMDLSYGKGMVVAEVERNRSIWSKGFACVRFRVPRPRR